MKTILGNNKGRISTLFAVILVFLGSLVFTKLPPLIATAAGNEYFVPDDGPLLGILYNTVQHGDTITVRSGNYILHNQIVFPLANVEITLQSEDGPENTHIIFDTEDPLCSYIVINQPPAIQSVLRGFTFLAWAHPDQTIICQDRNEGFISIQNTSPIIEQNIFPISRYNDAEKIRIWTYPAEDTSPIIRDNIFLGWGQQKEGGHSGKIKSTNASPIIHNNTITGIDFAPGTEIIYLEGDGTEVPIVHSNIIYGNYSYGELHPIYKDSVPMTVAGWNDIQMPGEEPYPGIDNINLDPQFSGIGSISRQYSLTSGSPCIDTGHPSSEYNDRDGTRADMGAFFYLQFMCGDFDDNEVVDISDLVYLIDYMFNQGPAPEPLEAADVNSSGDVDIADLVYLIDYMFTGGPGLNCPEQWLFKTTGESTEKIDTTFDEFKNTYMKEPCNSGLINSEFLCPSPKLEKSNFMHR